MNLRISNKVTVTAVNIIVSIISGGGTTTEIKAYILKCGTKYTAREITKKLVSKLLVIALKELFGVSAIIRIVIKNFLEPDNIVAEWLDNRYNISGNGYVNEKAF